MEKILDKLGQEITPGSYIVYGHALGRCAGLRFGKVFNAQVVPGSYRKAFRITVWGVNDDWNHREPHLLSKKSTLQFPDRMIVLDPSMLPKKLMDVFDTIKDSA